MKNSFGNAVTLTLFGESHGKSIGAVLDGLAPGIEVDEEEIRRQLSRRRPSGNISTQRRETDDFSIVSGVFRSKTTGTPLCIRIENRDTESRDYVYGIARPGHSDYTAQCKYHQNEDYRGGGHFSGRLTAALVAVGGILLPALEKKGIFVTTHLARVAQIDDAPLDHSEENRALLRNNDFPVLNQEAAASMKQAIEAAAKNGDSVGGVTETVISGLPAGVGEPWFDTVEGMLSHALFSIPAVKGVEFGDGFALADRFGSTSNDAYRIENGTVFTATNRQGGVGGGISNGMPIRFRCAVKPTPSIGRAQPTVDFVRMEEITAEITGRHDPCIAHRAVPVVDAVTALVLADFLTTRFGTDYLAH